MRYQIAYDQDLNCVVFTTEGPFDVDALAGSIDDIVNKLEAYPSSNFLGDHSLSSLEPLSVNDVRQISGLARKLADSLTGKKFALIFHGDLAFGLARMWQAFTEEKGTFAIGIYRSKEKAISWLQKDIRLTDS